jgi:hypothetical protein
MNVTLKLPDELAKQARHLALDEGKSLSALVADLLVQRLEKATAPAPKLKSLIETLAVPDMPDWFYEKEFLLPDRKETKHREFSFEPDAD